MSFRTIPGLNHGTLISICPEFEEIKALFKTPKLMISKEF
jgi:hypothetical protein